MGSCCCCCCSSNPEKSKKKKRSCTIILLDDTEVQQDFEVKDKGDAIVQRVCTYLDLMETAYFGLRYMGRDGRYRWIDPEKKISSQLKGLPQPHVLYFGVKFYASDPCKLVEEVTKYQFVLQLKQDILQGRLPLSDKMAAELFALSLQAELGDYDSRRHPPLYSSEFRFVPDQTQKLEEEAEQIHKTLKGEVPSSVEMKFLEIVKWLDLYGVDFHDVTGDDNIPYLLGLTPSGIIIAKDGVKVNNFFWPRISKVYFKGKYFMLRIRDKANDETTLVFLLPSRESSEYLWKCCVEHHAFFRLTQVKEIPGYPVQQLFRLGSRHRYSGRTEQQALLEGRLCGRSSQKFDRIPSRRKNRRKPIGAESEDIKKMESLEKKMPSLSNIAFDDLAVLKRNSEQSAALYRSLSTPTVLAIAEDQNQNLTDTIAPWERQEHIGLFSSSRHSLASSHRGSERRCRHRRSGSVDSNDSERRRRKKHNHRCKRDQSDNESDISRASSRGSRCHSRSHSRRRNRGDSGSETDSQHRCRRRSSRRNGSDYDLVDSELQWKMIQKQKKEQNGVVTKYQSAVVRDLSKKRSGYLNSGIDTEAETTRSIERKKHRRRSRSRSRSPDSGPVLPQEVKKHIEYHLVDPENLTEEEKKDIKYTKVQSEAGVLYKIRTSPSAGKTKYKVSRVPSTSKSSLERHRKDGHYHEGSKREIGKSNVVRLERTEAKQKR